MTAAPGAVLVVYALSRLARSTRDTIAIAERLEQAGADLVSLSEKIDTTSAVGRMVFRMLAVLAEFERDLIAERTRGAMAHKRARRERISRTAPYGSDLAGDGRTLVDNPRAANPAFLELLPVYVPSLVYLLHRLGGPGNIAAYSDDDFDGVGTRLRSELAGDLVEAVYEPQPGGGGDLSFTGWCNRDRFLDVRFLLPDEWHLGRWYVGRVMSEDKVVVDPEARREIALECDHFLGRSLATCGSTRRVD